MLAGYRYWPIPIYDNNSDKRRRRSSRYVPYTYIMLFLYTTGYKNHATYVTELRMAKTPETVANFLSQLAEKLAGLARHSVVDPAIGRFLDPRCLFLDPASDPT